ncbi:DNA-processing protein DprA [Parapedobacter sp. 10938]|uniref:DNA-processing protein DprA n=1 Tax=Parapedobacter flavus TaxID=3110225 RepID=UPI002DB7CEAF|nr:DNA-processing protein DprA [Parapedobacter sp. 10938]MEC3878881.1 DNA-processing protein DprA [Parapedobacter sp. 10938]
MSLIHQIALTKVNGVGPVIGRHLLSYFGSAEAVFAAAKKGFGSLQGLNNRVIEGLSSADVFNVAEKELQFIEKHNIQPLFWGDKAYPKRLAECADAPLLLYYRGNTDLNAPRMVSIVGTRNATAYGKSICADFIKALAPYHVTVISGLAYGIDSYAHRNALNHEIPTVGVLGHGLDRIYPAANREMAAKMLTCGGLLTEFPSGTKPDRQNFPMRNRIIAGLADVTIVVEAAAKGGALITAELANSYSRDVCAFPGSLNQEFSAGSNYLIKTHRAHLITGAKDLQYLMNWELAPAPKQSKQLQLPVALTASQQRVYDMIHAGGELSIDTLSLQLKWPQSKLAVTLLELEMHGVVVALPGKVYRAI